MERAAKIKARLDENQLLFRSRFREKKCMLTSLLIGTHALLGEVGVFSYFWVFVEIIDPTPQRILRAKAAAVVGLFFTVFSWITGGYHYLNAYQTSIKPAIKHGPMPWAHGVFMETKEHLFLYLPFLMSLCLVFLTRFSSDSREERKAVLTLSGLIVLLGLAMAGMGYMISSGYRMALTGGHP